VYQDHFYLASKNREAVSIPNATTAKQFVGSYNYETTTVASDSTPPHANTITDRNQYSQFRFETHLAAQRALAVYDELVDEFADFFGRNYPAVEAYRCNDAEFVFVMLNPFASKAKESIDRLRDSGWKVGLLRPRLLQPFPQAKFVALLNGKQAVAVIDQNISMGVGGELHTKLCAALYGKRGAPAILASFIGDLSGRELTTQEFFEMASTLRKAAQCGETPSPSLLLNEGLLRELNKNQA
jgi:pyruvate ferredoxin oxidoreductase alpha subunit